jgi:hypothetical protein
MPACMLALRGAIDTETDTGGGGPSVTVTVARADRLGSATETAPTVTAAGEGTLAGAMKTPAGEMVPTVASPPVTPLTCHVTAVSLVLLTVAVNV